jgi:hypothetical protein
LKIPRYLNADLATRKAYIRGYCIRADAVKCWMNYFAPQSQIQAWVERIPHHVKNTIEPKGGIIFKGEGRYCLV